MKAFTKVQLIRNIFTGLWISRFRNVKTVFYFGQQVSDYQKYQLEFKQILGCFT